MKVQKKKATEENISEKSKMTLEEFNKKNQKTNLLIHQIFLAACILINIILFVFIIIFSYKISSLKQFESFSNFRYKLKDKNLNLMSNEVSHKLVNLIFRCSDKDLCFSHTFENQTQLDNTLDDLGIVNPLIKKLKKLYFVYTSLFVDNPVKKFNEFLENEFINQGTKYYFKYFLVVESFNKRKYGIYLWSEKKDEIEFPVCFKKGEVYIYSFRDRKLYEYKGNECALKINKKYDFILGDNDFIIYNNFLEDGIVINSPLNTFKELNSDNNIIEKNGKFDIRHLEVFSLEGNKEYNRGE